MKTSINRSGGISLLHWPDGVSSRLGEAISHPKFRRRAKLPDLRIVPEVPKNDLFQYATAAKSDTGFWEMIAYAAVALSAAGALVVAFGI
jgi:hypothetical protein